jgi:hypothetical protein
LARRRDLLKPGVELAGEVVGPDAVAERPFVASDHVVTRDAGIHLGNAAVAAGYRRDAAATVRLVDEVLATGAAVREGAREDGQGGGAD